LCMNSARGRSVCRGSDSKYTSSHRERTFCTELRVANESCPPESAFPGILAEF
jgi:hypothetical protein